MTSALEAVRGAGVLHLDAIPLPVVLSVLAHLFDAFPATDGEAPCSPKLESFIWGAFVAGPSALRSTFLKAAARIIRNAGPNRSRDEVVEDLAGALPSPRVAIRTLLEARHDWRSSATRVRAIALFSLGLRDPFSGEILDCWGLLQRRGHEAFRELWSSGVDDLRSLPANRMLIDTDLRSGLGARLVAAANGGSQAGLFLVDCGQLIDKGGVRRLLDDSRTDFLSGRQFLMDDHVSKFIESRISSLFPAPAPIK
jgi:hypothetical protein